MINGAIFYQDGQAVSRAWTTEMIRDEIKRMDEITGLRGAEVPIELSKRLNYYAGEFITSSDIMIRSFPSYGRFVFSLRFFSELGRPGSESRKLSVVRHEYAHYVDVVKFLNDSLLDPPHGHTFREACKIVDCCSAGMWDANFKALEYLDARYPNCLPMSKELPITPFRMKYEDALWFLRQHAIFGGQLDHCIFARGRNPELSLEELSRIQGPVTLIVNRKRLRRPTKPNTRWWMHDEELDTYGRSYDEAIITLADKVLGKFGWW